MRWVNLTCLAVAVIMICTPVMSAEKGLEGIVAELSSSIERFSKWKLQIVFSVQTIKTAPKSAGISWMAACSISVTENELIAARWRYEKQLRPAVNSLIERMIFDVELKNPIKAGDYDDSLANAQREVDAFVGYGAIILLPSQECPMKTLGSKSLREAIEPFIVIVVRIVEKLVEFAKSDADEQTRKAMVNSLRYLKLRPFDLI